MKKNRDDQAENIRQQKELKIAELRDTIETKKNENANQYEQLEMLKDEMERMYHER